MRVMRIIRDVKIADLPPSERSRLDQHVADIMAFAFGMCETLFQTHKHGLDPHGLDPHGWWLLMVAAELEAGRTVDL